MIDRYQQALQSGREHWLFWPLVILFLQVVTYNTVFAKTGYFAYVEKKRELEKIRLETEVLKARREILRSSLGELEDDEKAFEKFSREHYLYDQNVKIIKFIEPKAEREAAVKERMDLEYIGRLYVLFCSIALFIITAWFWSRGQKREAHED